MVKYDGYRIVVNSSTIYPDESGTFIVPLEAIDGISDSDMQALLSLEEELQDCLVFD